MVSRCAARFSEAIQSYAGAVADDLAKLFDTTNERKSYELGDVCRDLPLDVILVRDTNHAWNLHENWAWNNKPMYASDYVWAFYCPRHQEVAP